jgi:hypothetical protein
MAIEGIKDVISALPRFVQDRYTLALSSYALIYQPLTEISPSLTAKMSDIFTIQTAILRGCTNVRYSLSRLSTNS